MIKSFRSFAAIASLASLAACGSISTNLLGDLGGILPGGTGSGVTKQFASDLEATQFNLAKAEEIGVIPKGDFALGCVNDAVADLGINTGPPPSFEPKTAGPLSVAAIAYIRKMQFDALRGKVGSGANISQACYALLGKITMELAQQAGGIGLGFVPGGNILSKLLGN